MADAFNSETDPQTQPQLQGEGNASFFTTTVGKVVIGAVAFVILLGAAGTAVWMFVLNGGSAASAPPAVQPLAGSAVTTRSASASATVEVPVSEPQERPLESTFTFRNVFAPTMKRPSIETTPSSSETSSTVDVPADTLYLQSVDEVDGERVATFIWNDQTYTLKEGESISGTPWKVLDIGDDYVVMLYGDTEVTLTVGQGLSK